MSIKMTRCISKYLFLFLLSTIRGISNYCVELPSGLEKTLIDIMAINTTQYDLLFSISSWPNILLCLIGGILIDRYIGLRLGLIMVVSSTLMGQVLWSMGAFTDRYYIMCIGRLLIGAGNDLTVVIDHAFKSIWFKDNLTLAISIDTAISRLGGTLALIAPTLIYRSLLHLPSISPQERLGVTLLTAGGLCAIAFLFSIMIVTMDTKRQNNNNSHFSNSPIINKMIIKGFPPNYWLAIAINMTFFPTAYAFVSTSQQYFIHKYGLSIDQSNIANAILFAGMIPLVPVIGYIMNKTRANIIWILTGVMVSVSVHMVFMTSYGTQWYIPFTMNALYSIAYTLVGPPLATIPGQLINRDKIATAYGIFRTNYNLSFSLVAIASGVIVDAAGYFVLEIFYTLILSVSLGATVLLVIGSAFSSRQEGRTENDGNKKGVDLVSNYKLSEKEELYSYTKIWNGNKWIDI